KLRLQARPPAAATLLALGDPVFRPPPQRSAKDSAARAASRGRDFAELPGTAREVKAIAALFARPPLLLRSEASEQRLEALREAKHWLRGLTTEEVRKHVAALPAVERGERVKPVPGPKLEVARPFAHPYYWSAFILVGDPD